MSESAATLTLCNKLGLHARAASKFVSTAARYPCDVKVKLDDKEIDGKSIMSLMLLAAPVGTELEIKCQGDESDQALEAISALINDRFGESC